MYVEEALLKQLLATSAVTALVGGRVYYVTAPQNVTTPYIVISKISDPPDKHRFDSASSAYAARIQVTIIDSTYYMCKQVSAAIKTAINGYKGTLGGFGGLVVGAVFAAGENDLSYDTDVKLYGVAVDYILHYN